MSLRKFEILEMIAKGGMAEVYRAQTAGPEGFAKELCVKKILPHLTEDEKFVRMFINEAKLAASLNFANIVSVHDLCVSANREYFIVMEYVHGKDLSDVIRAAQISGRTIPADIACYIGREVCRGLSYAHAKKDTLGHSLNIIHRDISPQNILCSYMGEIKITDFGIAKASTNVSHTAVGILKGKYGYMSPEQAHGKELDHRSDLFNLGIVLYEMLVGERCFAGASDYSTLNLMREAVVTPPTRINANIPKKIEDIVLKALSRKPEDRFQSAAEFEDSLKQFNQDNLASNLATFLTDLFSSQDDPGGDRTTGVLSLSSVVAPIPAEDTDKNKIPDQKLDDRKTPRTPISKKDLPSAPKKERKPARIKPVANDKKTKKKQEQAAQAANKKPVGKKHLKPGWTSLNQTSSRKNIKLAIKSTLAVAAALLLGFVGGSISMRGQSYELAFRAVENDQIQGDEHTSTDRLAVVIETEPPGAKIRIDDKAIKEKTPSILYNLEAGSSHRIELSLKAYQGVRRQFKVQKTGVTRISEKLTPAKPSLIIESEPAGADVSLNALAQGQTPLKIVKPKGQYQLELKLKDHLAYKKLITVTKDSSVTISKTLTNKSQAAHLEILTDVPAKIFLDGIPSGFSNSIEYLAVEPQQKLTLSLQSIDSINRETLEIELKPNEHKRIYTELKPVASKKEKRKK